MTQTRNRDQESMIKDQQITVLGAGIGGLAAATALAQRGAKVTVLEQAPAITEVGAGFQISPNGVRVLDALGVGKQARAQAVRGQGVWLRDGVSGHGVLDLDFRKLKPDDTFLLYHRADLQKLLYEAALDAGVTVTCGQRVQAVQPGGGWHRGDTGRPRSRQYGGSWLAQTGCIP